MSKETDVHAVVMAALGELLSMAGGVADMQTRDDSADEIYAMCDLVAEYFELERARAITTELDDGSFTTHFETFSGADDHDYEAGPTSAKPKLVANKNNVAPIVGSIRTKGKPKLRVVDCTTPLDIEPTDSDLNDIED